MSKYLKSYKKYPTGTIVVSKSYSLWKRFLYWIKKKRREYNTLMMLPDSTNIGISKIELLINDYYLFIPVKPYTIKEKNKLNKLLASCKTICDYLTAINIIRPNSVDPKESLEQFRNNKNYKKVFLDYEPFQEVLKHDSK